MATVRLTEALNKEILLEAKRLYDSRIVASNMPPPEFNTGDIYELWLDSDAGLREDIRIGIRHKWLVERTTFRLVSLNGKTVEVELHNHGAGVWIPYEWANSYGAGLSLKGVGASELYVIWKKWREEFALVRDSRDAFNAQVANLLKKHATLKQALSEWPALWDFVPAEFKKKHNEEKERIADAKRQAKENKPSVNLDVLNGAVVTAKILKGGFTG